MAARNKAREIETLEGRPLKEILIEKFDQLGTQAAVARDMGVDQATIWKWLLQQRLRAKTTLVDITDVPK